MRAAPSNHGNHRCPMMTGPRRAVSRRETVRADTRLCSRAQDLRTLLVWPGYHAQQFAADTSR